MKKILLSALLVTAFITNAFAQTDAATTTVNKSIAPARIGFSVIANDYATAQRIRSTSLNKVFRDKTFIEGNDLAYGFALTYFKGLTPSIDLAASIGSTFGTEVSIPGRSANNGRTLVEADASAHFKMFPRAVFNPYLIAGLGASKIGSVYGAILPLGGGVKFNIFNEAEVNVQLQYRIPVTPDANNYHFQLGFGIAGLL